MKKKIIQKTFEEKLDEAFNDINFIDNFKNQDFSKTEMVHDWKNYVAEMYKEHWDELTDREKKIIFIECEMYSQREEWD